MGRTCDVNSLCSGGGGAPTSSLRQATVQCRAAASAAGKVMLEVKGLEAKIASTGQQILRGVNLVVREVRDDEGKAFRKGRG